MFLKKRSLHFSTSLIALLLFVMPASTNYQMHDYGIGGGGNTTGVSTNYALNAMVGEVSGPELNGTNYSLGPGVIFTRQANVPTAPTFVNPGNYYDVLNVTVNTSGNPSDTTYAIAISSDNFVTTQYVQSNMTVGPVLGIEDYLTYAGWGGGFGASIIGLTPNTTYQVKVKAMHGSFTETKYSAVASASTVQPSLTFDIDISATNSESSAPYLLNFGQLAPASVTTASDKIWVDVDTNGNHGVQVAVRGINTGLLSAATGHVVSSATANLSAVAEGFGLQVATATQSQGGPLMAQSPYSNAGANVGGITTTYQTLLESTSSLSGGRSSIALKAKSSTTTPSANDYTEILTVIAAARF